MDEFIITLEFNWHKNSSFVSINKILPYDMHLKIYYEKEKMTLKREETIYYQWMNLLLHLNLIGTNNSSFVPIKNILPYKKRTKLTLKSEGIIING